MNVIASKYAVGSLNNWFDIQMLERRVIVSININIVVNLNIKRSQCRFKYLALLLKLPEMAKLAGKRPN